MVVLMLRTQFLAEAVAEVLLVGGLAPRKLKNALLKVWRAPGLTLDRTVLPTMLQQTLM